MTCLETYATLRVFSGALDPEAIGAALGLEGTDVHARDPESKYRHKRESHFWGWCSKPTVLSTDGIEHVSAIIERMSGKLPALTDLRDAGCEIDICCYWVTDGQGGPELGVKELRCLAELELPIWWDVYHGEPSEYAAEAAPSLIAGGA
jgi:hypothetical protein